MISILTLKKIWDSPWFRMASMIGIILAANAVTRWDAARIARLKMAVEIQEIVLERETKWHLDTTQQVEDLHARLDEDEKKLTDLKGIRDAILEMDFGDCTVPADVVDGLRDIR